MRGTSGSDVRLVPAAVAAWAACVGGVALGTPALVVAVVVAWTGTAACLVAAWRRGAGALTVVALVLGAAGAALTSCLWHVHQRGSGDLPALVEGRALVTVTGVVRGEPTAVSGHGPPRTRVVLGLHEVDGPDGPRRVHAPVVVLGGDAWADVAYGATVRTRGRLAPTAAGDRAAALLVADDPVPTADPSRPDRVVATIRASLLAVTDPLPPDVRGLVPGAAVGDRSRIPPELDAAMRTTGLTHVTAVSGAHFAVLSVCVLAAGGLLGAGSRGRAAGLLALAVGFVHLVHPEPSVVRAAGMAAVTVVGLVCGRPARAVPALAAAVVVLCVVDPWLARAYGFVLSVLATAAIVVGAPRVAEVVGRRLPDRLAVVVAVPLCAQAVCAPVLVLLEPSVSLVAVPANALVAPALVPATVFGVLAALVAPWWPTAAAVLVVPAAAASWWVAAVARWFAALPGATVPWPPGAGGALLLAVTTVLVVGVALRLVRARRGVRGAVLVVVVVALVVHLLVPERLTTRLTGWPPDDWAVVACDVGQGDALVVRSGPAAAVVVDTGPSDGGADRCLRELGVRHLDLLVLTHPHADHVGDLGEVLRGRTVDRVLVSPLRPYGARTDALLAPLADAGVQAETGTAGLVGWAGAVRWTVLGPTGEPREVPEDDLEGGTINDASVVLHLDVDGLSVVTLGDVEPAAQTALLSRLRADGVHRDVDVVKVAHHGSARQDADLAAWLSPTVAVVSAGADNPYGHPAPSTTELYARTGATVLSTVDCGPVVLGDAGRPATPGVRVWADCAVP